VSARVDLSRTDLSPRVSANPFRRTLGPYLAFMRTGLAILVGMGILRFVVGASGVPYDKATHLTSVTILVFLLALIYGQRAATRFGSVRHLVPVALILSVTMYGFILLAMSVEVATGISGYFHSPGSGYALHGMGFKEHALGQLSVMGMMTLAILGVSLVGYVLAHHLEFLRNAFLLLAAMAALRFGASAASVPQALGTWLTSLTLLSFFVALYYGYRAVAAGFDGYGHALLLATMIGFWTTHLIIYGIVISSSLGTSSYYHAPSVRAPGGVGMRSHVTCHLAFSPVFTLGLAAVAGTGLTLGRRSRRAT
jgi:hypothetical protein